jgi:hypothetical protein
MSYTRIKKLSDNHYLGSPSIKAIKVYGLSELESIKRSLLCYTFSLNIFRCIMSDEMSKKAGDAIDKLLQVY